LTAPGRSEERLLGRGKGSNAMAAESMGPRRRQNGPFFHCHRQPSESGHNFA
jgi:hypothetical protein